MEETKIVIGNVWKNSAGRWNVELADEDSGEYFSSGGYEKLKDAVTRGNEVAVKLGWDLNKPWEKL